MVKRIHQLTPEQRCEILSRSRKWIDRNVSTGPVDRALFEDAARRLYEHSGVPWHDQVVWVDSPLVLAAAAPIALLVLSGLLRGEDLGRQVADPLNALASAPQLGTRIISAVEEAVQCKMIAKAGPVQTSDPERLACITDQRPGFLEQFKRYFSFEGRRPQRASGAAGKRVKLYEVELLNPTRTGVSPIGALVKDSVFAELTAPGKVVHEAIVKQVDDWVIQEIVQIGRMAADEMSGVYGPLQQALHGEIDAWEKSTLGNLVLSAIKWERGQVVDLVDLGRDEMAALFFLLREVCGLTVAHEQWSVACADLASAAVRFLPYREFLIASERATLMRSETVETVARDGRTLRRLHCEHSAAMGWPDGWCVHAWHGVGVPAWVVENPQRMTPKMIDAERNAETRRVMLERFGLKRYISDCGAEVVDEVPPNHPVAGLRGARLLRKLLPGEPEPLVYLEMLNSTPDADGVPKRYLERIDPKAYGGDAGRLCHAAQASRWRYRDENGQLRLTFERWQDYQPQAES